MSCADLETVLDHAPQLLADLIVGVSNLEIAALLHNLLSSEGPLGVPPPAVLPPGLDSDNLGLVASLFAVHGGRHADVRQWI